MNTVLFTIGVMFVGSAIGAFLTQGTRTSLAVLALIIGLSLTTAAIFWSHVQSLFSQTFAQSLTTAASDARIWLLLLVIVWVFVSTLLFVQRTSDAEATTTAVQAQIVGVRNDLTFLQSEFENFKTPRSFSQKQFDTIVDFLATRDSQTITIASIRDDRETRLYAINISNALRKAGRNVTMTEIDDPALNLVVENYNSRSLNEGLTKAGVLMKAAFKEADVPLGVGTTGNGGPESTRLVVGSKRY